MFDKINIFLAFIVSVLILYSIKIFSNIFKDTTITDWLSVIIYAATLYTAFMALQIAKKALKENRSIAIDTEKMTKQNMTIVEETKKMVNDNQRLVEVQTEPFIHIGLEIMPQCVHWVRLKIKNIGVSSAFNISFEFVLKDRYNILGNLILNEFTRMNFIGNGINHLAKEDEKFTTFINTLDYVDHSDRLFESFLNTIFEIRVRYEDKSKKEYDYIFIIEMMELQGVYKVGNSFEENLINVFKDTNVKLSEIRNANWSLTNEVIRHNRNYWTESELKAKLDSFEKDRNIAKGVGRAVDPRIFKKISKRKSIHELRRENK